MRAVKGPWILPPSVVLEVDGDVGVVDLRAGDVEEAEAEALTCRASKTPPDGEATISFVSPTSAMNSSIEPVPGSGKSAASGASVGGSPVFEGSSSLPHPAKARASAAIRRALRWF